MKKNKSSTCLKTQCNILILIIVLPLVMLIIFTLNYHQIISMTNSSNKLLTLQKNYFKYESDVSPTITHVSQILSNMLTEKPIKYTSSTTLQVTSESTVSSQVSSVVYNDRNNVLLIICSDRYEYLKQTLDKIILYHPRNGFHIVISEDGHNTQVKEVVDEARRQLASHVAIIHIHHPYIEINEGHMTGYYKLSIHFEWALNQVFNNPFQHYPSPSSSNISITTDTISSSEQHLPTSVNNVLILEEDLLISSDFFNYFSAVSHLYHQDPTILAISAFNDHGQGNHVKDAQQLYRSDFFPGLGWMISKNIWSELSTKWPKAFWDDWLREPSQRKNRHIIRPEISRTFHIGSKGVSKGQFSNYLTSIRLNEDPVDFHYIDLSYLQSDKWDAYYIDHIKLCPNVTIDSLQQTTHQEVRIIYDMLEPTMLRQGNSVNSPISYKEISQRLGIMDDIKAGVPRTAYHGIVTVYINGIKVHITPLII